MNTPVEFSSKTRTSQARRFLSSAAAPRVFSRQSLMAAMSLEEITFSPRDPLLHRLLVEWQESGSINRVTRGVYLNNLLTPRPSLDEAAQHIRAGSIISLQTVLGRWGVLNNPVSFISCVLPQLGNSGQVATSGGVFEFHAMRPDMVLRPDDQEWMFLAFARNKPPTATPEKALLDWLWLSSQPASRLSPPPRHDIDINELDGEALDVLASKMGLVENLASFKKATVSSSVRPRPSLR